MPLVIDDEIDRRPGSPADEEPGIWPAVLTFASLVGLAILVSFFL